MYIMQPPGLKDPNSPQMVCKLQKALYGFKQALSAWFEKLRVALLSIGFVSTRTYQSLFIHHTLSHTTYVLVYVDDIVVTGSSSIEISNLV